MRQNEKHDNTNITDEPIIIKWLGIEVNIKVTASKST